MNSKLLLAITAITGALALAFYFTIKDDWFPDNVINYFSIKKYTPNTVKESHVANVDYLGDLEQQIRMNADSFDSINNVWIPYYHRHKNIDEAAKVIITLAGNGALSDETRQFFGILLRENHSIREDLARRNSTFKEGVKQIISELLVHVSPLQKGNFQLPVNHNAIWAEYAYSGDITLVQNYMRIIDNQEFDTATLSAVEDSLINKSRMYYPVYEVIKKKVQSKQGNLSIKFLNAYSIMKDSYLVPSMTYYYEAKNHLSGGDINKALVALLKSFSLYSDNLYLYYMLGQVLVEKKNYPDAILAYKRSNWLDPHQKDRATLFCIAETYDKMGDLNQTVHYYKEALAAYPDFVPALVNLTYTLDRLGDHKQMVHYAKEIVHKSDDIKNISWAKKVLESEHVDVGFVDLKLIDIGTTNLKNLLIQEKFEDIEKILSEAFRNKPMDENGKYKVYSMYNQLLPGNGAKNWQFEELVPKYQKWLGQNPNSPIANVCSGIFYFTYGWHARGIGYASSISEKGRKLFQERTRMAGKYLKKAYESNPQNGTVATKMISVAKVHPDFPPSALEKWFNLAIEADPVDPKPYEIKYYYLAPKWGGSIEEQFLFAREVFKNAPRNSSAPSILVDVHWYVYNKNNNPDYFKDPEVWTELKKVFSALIERFPKSMERHNKYAKTAILAGDNEIAQEEFKKIGENWDANVWESLKEFNKAKDDLF